MADIKNRTIRNYKSTAAVPMPKGGAELVNSPTAKFGKIARLLKKQ